MDAGGRIILPNSILKTIIIESGIARSVSDCFISYSVVVVDIFNHTGLLWCSRPVLMGGAAASAHTRPKRSTLFCLLHID